MNVSIWVTVTSGGPDHRNAAATRRRRQAPTTALGLPHSPQRRRRRHAPGPPPCRPRDGQATLTSRLAHQASASAGPYRTTPTIADAPVGAVPTAYHCTGYPPDYIPADHRLLTGRRQSAGQQPQPTYGCDPAPCRTRHDYVLLDCPPSRRHHRESAPWPPARTPSSSTSPPASWADGRQRMERMILRSRQRAEHNGDHAAGRRPQYHAQSAQQNPGSTTEASTSRGRPARRRPSTPLSL